MFINEAKKEYLQCSHHRDFVLLRTLYRCYNERAFLLRVEINTMSHSNCGWYKKYLHHKIFKKYGCEIGLGAIIGEGLSLFHPNGVVIGEGSRIGNKCTIYQNVTIGQKNNQYPILGDNVIIYPNSVLIGNITIGNNVTIGAGSIVINDVPDNAVVVGNPAKIVNILNAERVNETIKRNC